MSDDHRRGLDGLTSEELSKSRAQWWNADFTELLLRHIPPGTRTLVDVGCGIATAAHALLPRLPDLKYVGTDIDAQRLRDADRLLAGCAYRDRVELRVGRAEHMPCADGEADFVLTIAVLQHILEPTAVLEDMVRVLTSGGIFMAVEPDQLNNLIYFDGPLEDLSHAYRALWAALHRCRQPRDIAIGPAVARLAEAKRFSVQEFFPHVLGQMRKLTAGEFFAETADVIGILSATLSTDAPEVVACRKALAAVEARIDASTLGWGGGGVPVFVCVARRD